MVYIYIAPLSCLMLRDCGFLCERLLADFLWQSKDEDNGFLDDAALKHWG